MLLLYEEVGRHLRFHVIMKPQLQPPNFLLKLSYLLLFVALGFCPLKKFGISFAVH